MTNIPKWDYRFLELAKHVASWSKDPSTKVGAVIVNPTTKQVVGMGFNGFARGVEDTEERLNDRSKKLELTVHAEVNAVLNATTSVRGCVIYVYPTIMIPACCARCAGVIVQSGIKAVLGYHCPNPSERWMVQSELSSLILKEGGVDWYGRFTENPPRER